MRGESVCSEQGGRAVRRQGVELVVALQALLALNASVGVDVLLVICANRALAVIGAAPALPATVWGHAFLLLGLALASWLSS